MQRLLMLITLLVITSSTASADDWTRFRGPQGQGLSAETGVPLTWNRDDNIRWRTPLPGPGNNGSPIVSRGKVFIATATKDGRQRSLRCFDRQTGQELWAKSVEYDKKEPTHKTSLYAGTTPVADGERVVVWHSSAGMHCYDGDGDLQWSRDLGEFVHIWGYGASPIIHDELVICNCGPGERTFLIALDKRTGEEVWRSEEPGGHSGIPPQPGAKAPWIGSWSTPLIATVDGQQQVIVSDPQHVKAYNPQDGTVLWQCGGLSDLIYTSPLIEGDLGVVMGGFRGNAIGFTLGGRGDVTKKNRLWLKKRPPQRIGSGVLIDGYVYMINAERIAECIDAKTGEQLWQARPGGEKAVWASLIAIEGRLYATSQAGDTIVFAVNPQKYDELAINPIGETSNSTLAVSDGELFLRTFDALYCISTQAGIEQ